MNGVENLGWSSRRGIIQLVILQFRNLRAPTRQLVCSVGITLRVSAVKHHTL
jgi:hypothetical protein